MTAPVLPPLVLVGGGVRSGKSRFAAARACRLGQRRAFVATAEPLDDEMAARIRRHVDERGALFETVEVPVEVPATVERLSRTADVILVDCLTLWVSNLLVRGAAPADVAAAFARLAEVLRRRTVPVVLVSNEVGLGIVPETPLGRRFRDEVGTLHQLVGGMADELYAGVMGAMLRLHPGPVERVAVGGPAAR